MATGQVLINASGRPLLDGDGKVKLWAPAPFDPELAEYKHTSQIDTIDRYPSNETNWDLGGVDLLANIGLIRTQSVSPPILWYRSLYTSWWHRGSSSDSFTDGLTALHALRYDVSAHDGVDLALQMRPGTAWQAFDDDGDLESSVYVRFVYHLSNVAQASFSIDSDILKALPAFATLLMTDMKAAADPDFEVALPDTTGYDFLFVGVVLDWIYDGTFDWAYRSGYSDSPKIAAEFLLVKLIQA